MDENNLPNLLLRAGELNICRKNETRERQSTEAIDCLLNYIIWNWPERARIAKDQVKQLSKQTKTPYQAIQQR